MCPPDEKNTLVAPQTLPDKKCPEDKGYTCVSCMASVCPVPSLGHGTWQVLNKQTTRQVFLTHNKLHQLPTLIPRNSAAETRNEAENPQLSILYITLLLLRISHSEGAAGSKSPPKQVEILELKEMSTEQTKKRDYKAPIQCFICPSWKLPPNFFLSNSVHLPHLFSSCSSPIILPHPRLCRKSVLRTNSYIRTLYM